jgi:hypothetical protein
VLWALLVLASFFYIVTPIISVGTYFSSFYANGVSYGWLFTVQSVAFGVGILSLLALTRSCHFHLAKTKILAKFSTVITLVILVYRYDTSSFNNKLKFAQLSVHYQRQRCGK